MKKRVPALVLALALALTVPAWAAQDTPDNFVRSKTYAGQFSDLTPESTFYDNVAALYAYGLSVGKADGHFRPARPADRWAGGDFRRPHPQSVPHRRRGGRSRRLRRRE